MSLYIEILAEMAASMEKARKASPSSFYKPHDRGQRQFHQSNHMVRCLFPGNRFGKTTAMGVEAAWWINGRHPFLITPPPPIQVVWIAPQYSQFAKLKDQLDSQCFDAGWRFNMTENRYSCPNGSELRVIPCDRNWTYVQGINPDLVLCDEEPDLKLWLELQARAFGYRNGRSVKTKYVIAATATQSGSWMERDIYEPWRDHHAKLGVNEAAAVEKQSHPSIWVWPRGGIADNPMADAAMIAHYNQIQWASEEEKGVRMGGGFQNWAGSKVFAADQVAKLKATAAAMDESSPAQVGWLVKS